MTKRSAKSLAPSLAATVVLVAGACGALAQDAPQARQAADIAGTWELAVDNRAEACRLQLRAQKSDKGDYFPRHACGVPACDALARQGRPAGACPTRRISR